jgi:hypothetical protein
MAISNDNEFKSALIGLSTEQQRLLAARFAESVLPLCKDARVMAAINAAKRADVTEAELAVLFQAAKSANVESYTQCGKEADWLGQAGHFVAEAAMTCVAPARAGDNLAWEAAMRARMARTCEMIATGRGTDHGEAQQQYRIVSEVLKK